LHVPPHRFDPGTIVSAVLDDLGAALQKQCQDFCCGWRSDLVGQEASAVEVEAPRIESRCQRMIRRNGAEGRDALRAFVDSPLQEILEFAEFVAAVVRARQVVVLDADFTCAGRGRNCTMAYRCRQVRQCYLAKLAGECRISVDEVIGHDSLLILAMSDGISKHH
jgi:hypothetical protein